jgi:hypothetical protein
LGFLIVRRWLLAPLLAVILTAAPASAQLFVRGGGPLPSPVDQFQAALNATCSNCLVDLGAFVATSPTIHGVAWSCSAQPCAGAPAGAPTAATIIGSQGPNAVPGTWSGGTLDTDHGCLTSWGGGHQGYYGNEIYEFCLATLQWSRVSAPSDTTGYTFATDSAQVYPSDGQPIGSHTYDGQTYVPGVGLFNISLCSSSLGGCSGLSFKVDLTTLSSSQYNKWVAIPTWSPSTGTGGDQMAHYDSVTNAIYATVNSGSLYKLASPFNGSWTCLGTCTDQTKSFHQTAAIQPGQVLVVAGGDGDGVAGQTGLRVWSLSTGNLSHIGWAGDSTIPQANAPGFVWDSHASKFVGWNGGTTFYLLDPATWTFTAHPISVSNTVTPTCTDGVECTGGVITTGTFGRFQYDPAHNAFTIEQSILDHVFAYKPDF